MDDEIPELKVMSELAALFATLEEDETHRVLRWANEKYRYAGAQSSSSSVMKVSAPEITSLPGDYSDLPALMDAAKPTNGLERILVAAYFEQVLRNEPDFDSQSLNTQLKHLGYPSANIARDMVRLVARSPKFVIQTRKEGTSQQARKKFRLTVEGVRTVETMLRKGATGE